MTITPHIVLTMAWLRIVGLAVLGAMAYGIVHDQVTARVCVEYFTIGHPTLLPLTSPTLLAIQWGIVATWWAALPMGAILATAARAGAPPKLTARELVRPVCVLLGAMAVCALSAGFIGAVLASKGQVWLAEPLASAVPRSRHVAFLADLWAHSASYVSGFAGALVLSGWAVRRRILMRRAAAWTGDAETSVA